MEIQRFSLKLLTLLCALIAHITVVYGFAFKTLHSYFWIYVFLFYVFLFFLFVLKHLFFCKSQVYAYVFFILGPYLSSVLSDVFVMVVYFYDFFTRNLLNSLIGGFFMPYIALCAWFLSIAFFLIHVWFHEKVSKK